MKLKLKYILGMFIISYPSLEIFSQVYPVKPGWSFYAEPYVMFPNMNGVVAIGNLPEMNVNVGANQIFEKLQFGSMLYLEFSNEKWNVNSDLLYMDIGQAVSSNALINGGDIGATQLGWELAGLYKIKPWLELGLGTLLNSMKVELDVNRNNLGGGTTNVKKETTQTWIDPMVIAVFKNLPGEKFLYNFRGEVGGFGMGSKFASQLQAYAGYRFFELFEVKAGYRIISLDYNSKGGADYFLYNVDSSGPVLKFGFNF